MLNKTFDPNNIEESIYQTWEKANLFACKPKSSKPGYCIMMPPPNVTGSLHLGHALTYTLQDILARYKRMTGYDVLWQPGTDHAGIATQMVVEKQLKNGETRHTLGRSSFLEKVWEWKQQSGNQIVLQQKRLGISPDWARQRFTMDDGLSKAVINIFVSLYEKGLIYRDKRLVNWDVQFQTAVSDLEVITKDTNGSYWHIKYQFSDNPSEGIVVATTRPETLFGDQAVAVHPEDERYQHLIGKTVRLPFMNRDIPIIGDEYCDPEKGSSAVKITPAHDFNDFEVGKRHNLPLLNVLDATGHLNENVPKEYQGLDIETARKKVVAELQEAGLLIKEETTVRPVPYGERSGIEIQPYLTDQWFVDVSTVAKESLEAVEKGQTNFVPSQWKKNYDEWLTSIQPWCISRQIWWGHQIPVWYGHDGTIFVAHNEEEAYEKARHHYQSNSVELKRDEDVLDTWFSSALWPFTTLGWPEKTPELNKYYPTNVLVTGFDIIFFWVARMMMMGLYAIKDVPFKDVYIHALIRDEHGQKMSKTKGNVIDPLTMIERYGADALRFTLASLAVPGRDIRLGESRIESSRNFMTKIWNAARFLEMNGCFNQDSSINLDDIQNSVNHWILIKLNECIQSITLSIDQYRFDEASMGLYTFIWGTFCDDYIELVKPILQSDNAHSLETKKVARFVFEHLIKLSHPFIPYLSDHLWITLLGKEEFLLTQNWPKPYNFNETFSQSVHTIEWILELTQKVRGLKSMFHITPGTELSLLLDESSSFMNEHSLLIKRLARLKEINSTQTISGKGIIQFLVKDTKVGLNLGDAVDWEKEKIRLLKEKESFDSILQECQKRLSNENFCARAKPEVVHEMKEREIATKASLDQLLQILNQIQ